MALTCYPNVTELKAINIVQSLHNVNNLSNIATADSRSLDKRCLHRNTAENISNNYSWPTKYRVISSDYTTLIKFMKTHIS